MNWTLPGAEMEALWFTTGRDQMPYPTSYNPPRFEWADELTQYRRAAVESIRAKYTDEMAAALAVLDRPLVRIECNGRAGAHLETEVRVYAGIGAGRGALLRQLPNPARDVTGDFELTLCPPAEIARRVVAALPDRPAGRLAELKIAKSDLGLESAPWDGSALRARPLSAEEKVARVFDRPRDGIGEIDVFAGPGYDPASADGALSFFWMDFTGDGRYVVRNGASAIQARPTDRQTLTSTLDAAIARARQREATAGDVR